MCPTGLHTVVVVVAEKIICSVNFRSIFFRLDKTRSWVYWGVRQVVITVYSSRKGSPRKRVFVDERNAPRSTPRFFDSWPGESDQQAKPLMSEKCRRYEPGLCVRCFCSCSCRIRVRVCLHGNAIVPGPIVRRTVIVCLPGSMHGNYILRFTFVSSPKMTVKYYMNITKTSSNTRFGRNRHDLPHLYAIGRKPHTAGTPFFWFIYNSF